MNSVKLYSNGTAVICRECQFQNQEPLRVSIPVRKSDLDDVVSSLTVFGDVTITAPPTYIPTNAQETELTLDPARVLVDMATKLAGADVEIDAGSTYAGQLVGLHKFRRELNGSIVEYGQFVVLTMRGLQQVDEGSVTAIRFTDPLVQAEIDKALRSSLSRIKPDSSLIELTLQPKADVTSAFVTYATPVAAWKIRYQLRLSSTGIELEGQAVVDNDTDDDWTETLITVVTGEPITFSTDLAEIRRPARTRMNIVADNATGAVIAESMPPVACAAPMDASFGGIMAAAGGGGAPVMRSLTKRKALPSRTAQVSAEVHESGDFSLFTSPQPVTVPAKRSAIIPLFQIPVREAPVVLYYSWGKSKDRPFRAVRLNNPGAFSLGRGVCEIFDEGDFQGKCVLEPTRPGEEALLIYARETGVRVSRENGDPEFHRIGIQISDGVVYCEEKTCIETVYEIRNSQQEPFSLEIDHLQFVLIEAPLFVTVSAGDFQCVKTQFGQRIRVTLPASGNLQVTVREERIEKQIVELTANWLLTNVIEVIAPTSPLPGIQECIKLQEQIDALDAELNEKSLAARTLEEEEKRILKLIPNAHQEQANEWRTDLANAEKELRAIRRTQIPSLNTRLQQARNALQKALKQLQYSWTGEPNATAEPAS
ncbi:MAG: hypothetical protein JSS49_29535 [Planctomycetes bacterium]|nr:hypothetical protein [Planctomycetota bacterium]